MVFEFVVVVAAVEVILVRHLMEVVDFLVM